MTNALFINGLTFFAVFLTVFGANALLVDIRDHDRRRLKRRVAEQGRAQSRDRARMVARAKDFSQIAASVSDSDKPPTPRKRLELFIEQSGLELSVSRLLLMSAASAIVVAVVPAIVTRHIPLTLLLALGGAILPFLAVQFKRLQRLERLRRQLPDAFGLMSRVLRSGQTISQAMQGVAEEFSKPISLEFLYCYEQMNLGLAPELALRDMGRRCGLLEMKIFVMAVLVQRQAGGNLAELLDKLAFVVRERFRIRGMIQSLTAQGRFQALILLSLPIFMFFLLMFLRPEYEILLLQHPALLVTAIAFLVLGGYFIRKIVNFDW